ncbi:MAG: adenylate/guanylate cyclase domain-containing protein [bacterium]
MVCSYCKKNVEDVNFCPYCGKLLSTERVLPLEGLSLVFLRADLSGFTSLSEQMSAEDVMSLLNILYDNFYEIIVKYKGLLYQVIGDEIVGVFGLKKEDGYSVHLSVMAAEEIVKKVRECGKLFAFKKECAIKVGMEMAPASIYRIRQSLHHAIIVTDGFIKSLILQKNADNNIVLVGETLYQATRSFFEYEEYGELIENFVSVRAYTLKLK